MQALVSLKCGAIHRPSFDQNELCDFPSVLADAGVITGYACNHGIFKACKGRYAYDGVVVFVCAPAVLGVTALATCAHFVAKDEGAPRGPMTPSSHGLAVIMGIMILGVGALVTLGSCCGGGLARSEWTVEVKLPGKADDALGERGAFTRKVDTLAVEGAADVGILPDTVAKLD